MDTPMANRSLLIILGMVSLTPGIAYSQTYPSRPVRLIVPFAAGGPADAVGRLLVPGFAEAWGQQLIIDNRGGANSIVGSEVAARSAPDGYTLLLVSAGFTIIDVLGGQIHMAMPTINVTLQHIR